MRANLRSIAVLGVLLLAPALGRAFPTPVVNVQSVSFDINALWTIYNSAKQTNNQLTQWPPELNDQAGVVLASLRNTGTVAVKPYFRLSITESSSTCSSHDIFGGQGPIIQLKDNLAPGESRVANAAAFQLPNPTVNALFCQAFQDNITGQLSGLDPSKLQAAIQAITHLNFQVCLQQCDSGGSLVAGAQKGCTSLNLFAANNVVNQTIVAMLIYPHNNTVPNPFPNFIWSPAILSTDVGRTDVYYTLEVTEQGQQAPLWSVDIAQPNAQFYQWTGADRPLEPGKSYCWKVISNIMIGNVKKPVGGNGKGWNITKCFTVAGDAPDRCHYTKEDLDKWLQENGEPGIKEKLKDQTISNILQVENDPVICRLLSGKVKFTSIKVVQQ